MRAPRVFDKPTAMRTPAILRSSAAAILLCGGFWSLPVLAAGPPAAEWHRLSDPTGREGVEARFEGIKDSRYLLRRRNDAKLFEVNPGLLTKADRLWLDAAAKRLESELAKLNPASGHPLFSGTPFEVRQATEIAAALGLPQESKTRHGASWRLYQKAGASYRLFGAMPYSLALYADAGGCATSLSAVFANKGDFGSKAGEAEKHFEGGNETTEEALEKAISKDDKTLEDAIRQVLGEPRVQRFGEGKSRRTLRRWDWNGHSVLLSREPGEYVSLMIVPVDLAEADGRTARTADKTLRERLKADVRRDPNGDVYLTQIPMVNQGPKGYCVPATFERALRTMGIESDMYLLAMVGGTGIGGGTSVGKLLDAVRSQVYSKGRRTRDIPLKELRVRDVKSYLDEGIPVMWTMMAVDEYGKITNENTKTRKTVTDWAAHAASLKSISAPFAKKEKPNENHHICLIVGYNEATDELAVSDSWGAAFERRWVPAKVASWASQGSIFLILP